MIPRNEAAATAAATYATAAKALEDRIDEAIRRHVGGSVCVDLTGIPAPAYNAVAAKFKGGGWQVDITHDQRDGSFISLK